MQGESGERLESDRFDNKPQNGAVRKRGTECFTTKFAKLMAKGMVMAADAGYSLKVELSQGGDAANASVTPLEEWIAKHDARSS